MVRRVLLNVSLWKRLLSQRLCRQKRVVSSLIYSLSLPRLCRNWLKNKAIDLCMRGSLLLVLCRTWHPFLTGFKLNIVRPFIPFTGYFRLRSKVGFAGNDLIRRWLAERTLPEAISTVSDQMAEWRTIVIYIISVYLKNPKILPVCIV